MYTWNHDFFGFFSENVTVIYRCTIFNLWHQHHTEPLDSPAPSYPPTAPRPPSKTHRPSPPPAYPYLHRPPRATSHRVHRMSWVSRFRRAGGRGRRAAPRGGHPWCWSGLGPGVVSLGSIELIIRTYEVDGDYWVSASHSRQRRQMVVLVGYDAELSTRSAGGGGEAR
jgi:hypothetical protein